ncbi:MAG TPA: hypothetical protein VGQ00_03620 [Candidatus Norongarragalinales archaeon]|nr:hypothetical protein [Candidatus Norongarragalinales archaeon]
MSKLEKFLTTGHPSVVISHLRKMRSPDRMAIAFGHPDFAVVRLALERVKKTRRPDLLIKAVEPLVDELEESNEVIQNPGIWSDFKRLFVSGFKLTSHEWVFTELARLPIEKARAREIAKRYIKKNEKLPLGQPGTEAAVKFLKKFRGK